MVCYSIKATKDNKYYTTYFNEKIYLIIVVVMFVYELILLVYCLQKNYSNPTNDNNKQILRTTSSNKTELIESSIQSPYL